MASKAPQQELNGADQRFGYKFGCDGLASVSEACELLGAISVDTLERLRNEGRIRIGKFPGRRTRVVCRRSISEYTAGLEQ